MPVSLNARIQTDQQLGRERTKQLRGRVLQLCGDHVSMYLQEHVVQDEKQVYDLSGHGEEVKSVS